VEFVFLIHGDEKVWDGMSEADEARMDASHARFGKELHEAGVKVLYGCGLARSRTGRLVRAPGSVLSGPVVDGPYAEGREQLGGIWVLDLPGAAEAEEWAKRMPYAPGDLIEIRPVRAT
jgi:hypothetical protein